MLATINADHPQRGILRAFQAKFGRENVYDFDYLDMRRRGMTPGDIGATFVQAAKGFDPDWIFMQVQDINVLPASAAAEIASQLPGCVLTHWTGDLRPEVSSYMAEFSRICHITFISSEGQIPIFQRAGARDVRYLQIGLDWEEDVVGLPIWTPPFRVPDVVFCGNYYGSTFPGTTDRLTAIRTLESVGVDVGVVGSNWPPGIPWAGNCGVKQQHHIWKRAKICLNINHFNDVQRYFSDRQIIAMASGVPLVCHYVPNLEKDFVNGFHCLWYKSQEELVRCVRELLDNEALRENIGQAGRNEVITRHTWERRVEDSLPIVQAVRDKL